MRESLALFWPAYHARRDAPPPMPPLRISIPCYAETLKSIQAEMPALEARLPDLVLPVGFIAPAKSPIPVQDASGATAARIPGAWLEVTDEAGHFPWLERARCVAAAPSLRAPHPLNPSRARITACPRRLGRPVISSSHAE
jgi:pimeloyl-ACP methyl ester carboxylesterase